MVFRVLSCEVSNGSPICRDWFCAGGYVRLGRRLSRFVRIANLEESLGLHEVRGWWLTAFVFRLLMMYETDSSSRN